MKRTIKIRGITTESPLARLEDLTKVYDALDIQPTLTHIEEMHKRLDAQDELLGKQALKEHVDLVIELLTAQAKQNDVIINQNMVIIEQNDRLRYQHHLLMNWFQKVWDWLVRWQTRRRRVINWMLRRKANG